MIPARRTSLAVLALAIASCALPVVRSGAEYAERVSPTTEARRRHLAVGFLVVDGVYNSELMAPYDIFHHTAFHVQPAMRVFTVAPRKQTITTFEGLRLQPDHDFADCPPIDVLVVPSAEGSMDADLADEAMVAFVRERGAQALYVMSLCDGAFVLAEAGLLDGREATTFPADRADLAVRYPAVSVLDDVSFVHDGPTITSAGGARSYDPALYLVERLYGAEVAAGVARGMVIDWDADEIDHVVRDARPIQRD